MDKEKVAELIKEISKLSEQEYRIKQARAEYVEIAKELIEISDKIKIIAKKIDPVIAFKQTRNNDGYNREVIMGELYAQMQNGVTMDRKLLESTYPEYDNNRVAGLLMGLEKMSGVIKTKIDGKVKLTYNK